MKEVFDLIADKIQEAYKVGYQAGYLAGSQVVKKSCVDEGSSENPNKWIPVSERLPEKNDIYVVWTSKGFGNHLSTSYYNIEDGWTIDVCAWKENGEPYKAESEE